jgi:hypothetical protein
MRAALLIILALSACVIETAGAQGDDNTPEAAASATNPNRKLQFVKFIAPEIVLGVGAGIATAAIVGVATANPIDGLAAGTAVGVATGA